MREVKFRVGDEVYAVVVYNGAPLAFPKPVPYWRPVVGRVVGATPCVDGMTVPPEHIGVHYPEHLIEYYYDVRVEVEGHGLATFVLPEVRLYADPAKALEEFVSLGCRVLRVDALTLQREAELRAAREGLPPVVLGDGVARIPLAWGGQ